MKIIDFFKKLLEKPKKPDLDLPISDLESSKQGFTNQSNDNLINDNGFFFEELMVELVKEASHGKPYFTPKFSELEAFKAIQKLDNRIKADFGFFVLERYMKKMFAYQTPEDIVYSSLVPALFKYDLYFTELHFIDTFYLFINSYRAPFPMSSIIKQLKKYKQSNEIFSKNLTLTLQYLEKRLQNDYHFGQFQKEITEILYKKNDKILPVFADNIDDFGVAINQSVEKAISLQKPILYQLLGLLFAAKDAKPSNDFFDKINVISVALGSDIFEALLFDWLSALQNLKIESREITSIHHGSSYTNTRPGYLIGDNHILAKGLIWAISTLLKKDSSIIYIITEIAINSYKEIPGIGAASSAAGNVCIYVLSNADFEGVIQLSIIKNRTNRKNLIQKKIEEYSIRKGHHPNDLEDLLTPNFDLDENGRFEQNFGVYRAVVSINAKRKVEIGWLKEEKAQKTVPAEVKEAFGEELKALQKKAKQIGEMLTAQSQRMEGFWLKQRQWTYNSWESIFFKNGLLAALTKQLIWYFEKDNLKTVGIYFDGQ